jgi:hypothetical protein
MDPSKQAKAVKKAVKATVGAAASRALAKLTWLGPPAADALVVRDSKAGRAAQPGLDPE